MKITRAFVRRSARLSLAGVALLAFSAMAVEPGGHSQSGIPVAEQPRDEGPRTVTLITGDQVVISAAAGHRGISVLPRKGREHIGFMTTYEQVGDEGEHAYVIPNDALPLIGAGKLDRALFDVTALTAFNYDDATNGALPLVITYQDGQQQRLSAASASVAGAATTYRLDTVNGAAVSAPKHELGRWWDSLRAPRPGVLGAAATSAPQLDSSIEKIWLDRLLQPALDRSAPQIGAPALWDAGYTGEGIFVAVIDTGVDATHPDLVGRIVADRNFTLEPAGDMVGHGTHVASTIAGSGVASAGRYRGIASGARVISAKVCQVFGCALSSIIAGMEWAVTEQGAKIVNMSLGGPDSPGIDPVEETVNRLTVAYGALFVVAAGNSGQGGAFTVSSPSTAEAALSVAALDRSNVVAVFSSRGPRLEDRGAKPEIAAPGVGIVAARAAGTNIGAPVGDSYVALSGTSMATPHVAGAAALLSQRYPQWGPEQLKAALMSSARFEPTHSVFDYGAGRLDVAAAAATSITSAPASFSLGIAPWPHEDDEIITRSVTYRNGGATASTLTLRAAIHGPDGNSPPEGLFTLSPATLIVPAGGMGTATLTVNTRVAAALGVFSGRLVATGAEGTTIVTPLALEREAESYSITLRHIDLNGAQPFQYQTVFFPLDRDLPYVPRSTGLPGDVTLRVPAGRYLVSSAMAMGADVGAPLIGFVHPIHVVEANATLIFDARAAKPIDLPSPAPGVQRTYAELGWQLPGTAEKLGFRALYGNSAPGAIVRTATFGERHPDLVSHVSAQWKEQTTPTSTGTGTPAPTGDPALYAATWVEHGALPAGRKAVRAKDMAVVQTTFAPVPNVGQGSLGVGTLLGDFAYLPNQTVNMPGSRTEYYYASEPIATWVHQLNLPVPGRPPVVVRDDYPQVYRAKHRYQNSWNKAPLGPLAGGTRTGNLMGINLPLHSDQAGHRGYVARGVGIKLYGNSELLASISEDAGQPGGTFPVPRERTTYRLEATGRQQVFGLSSQVDVAWTFDSEYAASAVRLPLMTVSFKPDLNEQGQAYRRIPLWMPITVKNLGSGEPMPVGNLSVEASFDNGATWHRVLVKRADKQWFAVVLHPKQGDHVSLRASARDYAGNEVEQTIIKAYGLRDRPREASF